MNVQGLPPLGPRGPLDLRTRRYGTGYVVVLAGELGADGAAQLKAYLRDLGPESNVILDLWDVPQCDSAGVTAIGDAKEYVEQAGWGFAVVGDPKGLCTAALQAAGQVPIFATRSAARAALTRATS